MVESTHAAGFWPSLYEPLRGLGGRIADWFAPASEAGTDKQGYRIDLELPGVKQEDVDITVHDHTITVKGEKREHSEREEGNVFFCERQYGAFQRTFRLPPDADADSIAAEFADGLLTLRVPRVTEQKPGARKIAINKT